MSEQTGHGFVILNRGGAGGTLGAKVAASSEPDGYTILLTTNALGASTSLFKTSYNPETDFLPLAQVSSSYLILVTSAALPAHSVGELVTLARSNSEKLSFGSSGLGTPIHLAGELFKKEAGLNVIHIPYPGSAPALQDIIGNRVTFMFDAALSSLPLVRANLLRALAVTAPQRLAELPNIPTMKELGYQSVNVGVWYWLLAPKNIPACVANYYDKLTHTVLDRQEVKARIANLGADGTWFPATHVQEVMHQEIPMWSDLVQNLGLK